MRSQLAKRRPGPPVQWSGFVAFCGGIRMGLCSVGQEKDAVATEIGAGRARGAHVRRSWLILLALGCGIALARIRTWDEPLERDLTTYAVIGHNLLQGRSLYSDLWDNKPPAIFVTYALSEYLFGYGPASVYALNVFASLLTLCAVYAAGSWSGDRRAGLWAAAFWAVWSGDPRLLGNQPNTEVFMNACLAGGFALVVRCRPGGLSFWRSLAAGALFMAASAYKQVVVVVPAFLALAHVAFPPSKCNRRRALADMTLVVAVGVFGWLSIFMYFHLAGGISDFVDTVFRYAAFYAGHPLRNLTLQFEYPTRIFGPLRHAAALLLMTALGLLLRGRKDRRSCLLWLSYAIAVDLSVQATVQAHRHYFQLWLPPLVIASAWGVAGLSELGPWMRRYGATLAGVCVLGSLLIVQVPYYFKSARQWCTIKYGPGAAEVFAESVTLGRKLDQVMQRGETFYVWGAEPGVYYASGRDVPTGVILNYPLVKGPLYFSLSKRVVEDLERSRPVLIVTLHEANEETHLDQAVNYWWHQRYHPWPGNRWGPFELYARNNSGFEDRLKDSRPVNNLLSSNGSSRAKSISNDNG
jgi:hypothetical protein